MGSWHACLRAICVSSQGAVTAPEKLRKPSEGYCYLLKVSGLQGFEPWLSSCLQAVSWTTRHMEVILYILSPELFCVYTSKGYLHGHLKDRIWFLTQAVEIMTLRVWF